MSKHYQGSASTVDITDSTGSEQYFIPQIIMSLKKKIWIAKVMRK